MAGSMAGAGGKMALVDFRALKTLLPETVGAINASARPARRDAALGMGASHAEGRYEGPGGARLKMKIIDMAGIGGLALAGMGLAAVEVDKETEHGYERTTMLAGNKALEKYDSRSKHGEVRVIVGGRFMVEVDGQGVPMDAIKDATAKVNLAASIVRRRSHRVGEVALAGPGAPDGFDADFRPPPHRGENRSCDGAAPRLASCCSFR